MGYFIISVYLSIVLALYYHRMNIPDFLIFSLFYLALSIFALSSLGYLIYPSFEFVTSIVIKPSSSPVLNILYYFSSISGYVFYFFINLYFARGVATPFTQNLRSMNKIGLVINLIMYLPLLIGQPFYFDIGFNALILIRWICFMVLLSIEFLILVEGVRQFSDKGSFYFDSKAIERSWKTAIWLTIVSTIVFSLKFVQLILQWFSSTDLIVVDGLYLLSVLPGLLAIAIVMGISIRHPEALLVFRYQIVRAVMWYQEYGQPNPQNSILSLTAVSDYIYRAQNYLVNQSEN